jgi:ABC transport system ATP-binding/permease protein
MNPAIGHSASLLNGTYDTYRRLKAQVEAKTQAAAKAAAEPEEGPRSGSRSPAASTAGAAAGPVRKPGKLSFKEQREYEGIEPAIQAAEARKAALEASLADPATYQKGGADWAKLRKDFDEVTAEVERLYARWEALEAIKAGG